MKNLTTFVLIYFLALSFSLVIYIESRPGKIELFDITKYDSPTTKRFQLNNLKLLKEYEFMCKTRPSIIAGFAFHSRKKDFDLLDINDILTSSLILDSKSMTVHVVAPIGGPAHSSQTLIYRRGDELLIPLSTEPYLKSFIISSKNKLIFLKQIDPSEGVCRIHGLFDLNKDGRPEVLMTFSYPSKRFSQEELVLYDMETGEELWKLKRSSGIVFAVPYDLNKDGNDEIFIYSRSHEHGTMGSGSVELGRTQFWIIDRFGNIIFRKTYWGFYSNAYPIIDDLDNDGNDELTLIHFNHYLYNRGTIEILSLPGLKTQYRLDFGDDPPLFPIINDINDDGEKEIIAGTSHGRILILNDRLKIIKDTLYKPLRKNYDLATISVYQVVDLDGDGRKEIIAGVRLEKIYVRTPRGTRKDVKTFIFILDSELNILRRINSGMDACVYDINHDGVNELIVKKEKDGIQIWGFEEKTP